MELVMTAIENNRQPLESGCNAQTVTAKINERFRQHGVGYQYESGRIMKISNQVLHAEATVPALHLLSGSAYKSVNDEFLKAHEHYRHGRNAECLVECSKAFESTMKIICKAKKWSHDQTDTASKLIRICLHNRLVPTSSEKQLNSLQGLLESGIPAARNKYGAHGQGVQQVEVDDYLAQYVLHLTGATIVLLVKSAERNPRS